MSYSSLVPDGPNAVERRYDIASISRCGIGLNQFGEKFDNRADQRRPIAARGIDDRERKPQRWKGRHQNAQPAPTEILCDHQMRQQGNAETVARGTPPGLSGVSAQ